MKIRLYLVSMMICAGLMLDGCAQDTSFEDGVAEFQQELNDMFSDSTQSPLPEEERVNFEGLSFYEAHEDFLVKADFKRVAGRVVEMPTTTDRIARYQPYGKLNFELNGEEHELTVFQNIAFPSNKKDVQPELLFLPYSDLTNGKETYGGGRYIDLEPQDGSVWELDFNKSYNPFCAYNAKYSCPIPPSENHLDTQIKAGVKAPDTY